MRSVSVRSLMFVVGRRSARERLGPCINFYPSRGSPLVSSKRVFKERVPSLVPSAFKEFLDRSAAARLLKMFPVEKAR